MTGAVQNAQLLLQPFLLGDLALRNRIVMAPMTRMRATTPAGVPNALMQEYYRQRATAGLIITEGTFVSDQARGWFGAPGVYTEAQRKAWQSITDAVHAEGGHIIVQLWHQGSVSNATLVCTGRGSLAPSAVDPQQHVYTGYGPPEMTSTPEAMSLKDIRQTIADFRHAAKVARDAGFDGVQIQGGFVYLFQQFLQENLNLRTDQYGGTIENRARILFEVIEAVLEVWPSTRVGVKAGPMMSERGGFRSLPSTLPTAEYIYRRLNDYNLSHLMVMRQQADLQGTPIHALAGDEALRHAREFYSGTRIINTGITAAHAEELLQEGLGDLAAFGQDFIANPDLVERIRSHASLNERHPESYYGAASEGYTDYPTLSQASHEEETYA